MVIEDTELLSDGACAEAGVTPVLAGCAGGAGDAATLAALDAGSVLVGAL